VADELLRDLKERNIRTRTKQLSTGVTRGGIPFGRGALYYVLGNHFYIGEVKYKNEILPGEQPPIMDRELFDAVRQNGIFSTTLSCTAAEYHAAEMR
jgi:site-specific DNA recombinase